jgi:hypothetical protein
LMHDQLLKIYFDPTHVRRVVFANVQDLHHSYSPPGLLFLFIINAALRSLYNHEHDLCNYGQH